MDISSIQKSFINVEPYINGWEKMKRASVIIPLVEVNGEVNILFEVRAKKLISQPGDICFPGGKIDKGEWPKEAAQREIFEELGLSINDIKVVNELDTLVKHDGLIIHPFLGVVENTDNLNINEDEVDHIFYVPIEYLLSYEPLEINNKLIVERGEGFPYHLIVNGENYKFRDGQHRSLFYQYKDYVIWGITAEMLTSFLNKIR